MFRRRGSNIEARFSATAVIVIVTLIQSPVLWWVKPARSCLSALD